MDEQPTRRRDTPAALEKQLVHYLRSIWPSSLSQEARSNLLALYRDVADPEGGRPLTVPHAEIPAAWLERDASGELLGVAGLTRAPTPHQLELRRRRLYAWCAFDCMFLPAVLGAPLEVRSACAASGRRIHVRVFAGGVESASPRDTVISFVTPDGAAVAGGLRRVFCRHVRFFESAQAAGSMVPDDVRLLDLSLAHRLGAIRNRIVFGDTLAPDSG